MSNNNVSEPKDTYESLKELGADELAQKHAPTIVGLLERLKPSFVPKPEELVPMRDIGGVTESGKSVTGNKLDSNKPKISLIPQEAILEMAIAFTYGANKYSADNFKNGITYRRLIDAALRHIFSLANGEDLDLESSNTHVGHALASLAMLAYMMKNKPEFDDRYKPNKGLT